jgi:hypothetical protein
MLLIIFLSKFQEKMTNALASSFLYGWERVNFGGDSGCISRRREEGVRVISNEGVLVWFLSMYSYSSFLRLPKMFIP